MPQQQKLQQQQHQPLQPILRYATRQATQGSLVGLPPPLPACYAKQSATEPSETAPASLSTATRWQRAAYPFGASSPLHPPPHRQKRQKLCALQKVLAARSLKPSIAKRLHTARQREAERRVTCFKLVLFELNFVLFHFALLPLLPLLLPASRCVWPFCFN